MTVPGLRTRPPTGRVPWPLILIEGGEKSGKSWACAVLSASPRVGQTYWLDLGEGAGDEYGAIPDARYQLIEHDGSWRQILAAVEAVRAEAQRAADAGEPPVVLVVDSATAEWELLKGLADTAARDRLKKKGKHLAADQEPQISMDLWNEANARHRKFMTYLMTMPGIAVVTARGKEVAALDDNGRPIERSKEYRVEGQKGLAFDATCWVRLDRNAPGVVVGARSVHAGIRPGYDKPKTLPDDWTLEWLIFEGLRCDPASAHVRDIAPLRTDDQAPDPVAPPDPNGVRDWALHIDRTAEGILKAAAKLRAEHPAVAATQVINESGDEEQLGELLDRRARELTPAAPASAEAPPGSDGPAEDQDERRRKRMFALFREAGYDGDANREQRHKVMTHVLNRPVESSKDLSPADVEAVIDALDARVKVQRQQARNQERQEAGAR
jgi:hypothetical protein